MKSSLLERVRVQSQQSFPHFGSLFPNKDKQQSPSLYPLHKYRAWASILSCLDRSRRPAGAPARAIKAASRTFDGLSSQGQTEGRNKKFQGATAKLNTDTRRCSAALQFKVAHSSSVCTSAPPPLRCSGALQEVKHTRLLREGVCHLTNPASDLSERIDPSCRCQRASLDPGAH